VSWRNNVKATLPEAATQEKGHKNLGDVPHCGKKDAEQTGQKKKKKQVSPVFLEGETNKKGT